MSKIIQVSVTTTESEIAFDATYQFAWFRNLGGNDCLLSDHSSFSQSDDNVTLVKAGESGRISTTGKVVYIKAVSGTSTGEIHAQNFAASPFKRKAKGGGQTITVEPLTVTDNGVYTAPTGKAYSPVTVDVQEKPWQPLEDGYSNFWFELTNDTLSPWLNFSAKTENAVIDWGDGSGEVALDTLTPTHTYSKAGRYVVKCKGVTGIEQQYVRPLDKYSAALKYVELNSDVAAILQNGFMSCAQLRNIVCHNSATTFGANAFNFCPNLVNCEVSGTNTTLYGGVFSNCFNLLEAILNSGIQTIGSYAFNYCMLLQQITLPSTVTAINTGAFGYCVSLRIIHVQATTPPTLGNNVFTNLPSDYIIYVPVGTGETYKAASGWSTYADHILEEGQTPNRMMLAKFNSAKTDEPQDDMR